MDVKYLTVDVLPKQEEEKLLIFKIWLLHLL